ncbi:hypothetical protein C6501_15225 [Candidatus Poribacteria bacterium]|nr:MAG: hypothetical protein C6501_15225 [Candidatus Poribacteria bacterium]
MVKKLKHLELIQNVINRLANSSFYLKGWTVIFVAAVLGFATKDSKPMYASLAAIPTLFFWGLDGFYLNQERLFRRLYDAVRETDEDNIDFSMNTVPFKKNGDWFKAIFSKTLLFFYFTILLVIGIVLLWQWIKQDIG